MERVDGSGVPRQLTRDGRVHVDAWSPDGRTLMVHKHRPTNEDTDVKGGAKLDHGGGGKLDHLAVGRSV